MNPYPHHASLGGSPHHPPGPEAAGHHYGAGPPSGNGTATTPDPSPHSPPYHGGPGGPQDSQQPGGYPGQGQQAQQCAPSNGHHAMMQQEHRPYQHHPHMPSHMAGYPPVNHNNNCTLKQEGGPNMSSQIQQCAHCGTRILDRYLLYALERYWHNNCLKCSQCGTALAEVGTSCYSRGNLILCKSDYTRMFGSTGACAACGQTIPATELVTRAGGSVFHTKCFTCTKCGQQLTQGDRYYLLSGAAVCEMDFQKIVKSTSVAAAAAAAAATGNGGMPTRKGKVGRPRRSRE